MPATAFDGRPEAVLLCAGTDHVIMLTRGGQVMSWGTAGQGQLGRIGVRHLSRDDKVRRYYTATTSTHIIATRCCQLFCNQPSLMSIQYFVLHRC